MDNYHPNLDGPAEPVGLAMESAASAGYVVGDKVRLLRDIWEGEIDGLIPPQHLGRKGEVLVVKGFGGLGPSSVKIAHGDRTDDAYFVVFTEEIEKA